MLIKILKLYALRVSRRPICLTAVRLNGVIVSELRSFRRALEALRPSVLGSWPCACSCSSSCLALALALAVALALRLALPLVFALASASFFARRKRQHGPPEEPKSTPGGSPNGLLEASGPEAGPKWPGPAPEPPLDGSWSALGGSWSRLGALLAPLGAV